MLNADNIQQELSRRSLLYFAKTMETGFEDPPHIRLLAEMLQKLERGDIRRLCVSMPPRFGKTTLCSQLFPSFCVGRDPKRTVILANHSSELAASFSRKAKGYIESPFWPFSRITLSEDSRAVHRWNVTPGNGGLFSVGVGSGVTGVGADFLIVDDPINDGLSQTERDQAWQWFREVAFPRCNAGARILVVSARLAVDDLPGHLMESDDADLWKFVSLPAINQDGNELGLEPGTPLWDRFGHEELSQRREAMGLGPYQSQMMQDPSIASGGKVFRMEDFGTWNVLPHATQRPWGPTDIFQAMGFNDAFADARPDETRFVKIVGCDFAGTENTSTGGSYSAMVSTYCDLRTGEVYIKDCWRWRNLDFFELRNQVVIKLAEIAPDLVVIESNDVTGGRMIGDLSRTTRWPIKPVKPKSSKIERAVAIAGPLVESHKVFLPARATANIDDLKRELAAFGPGARYTDLTDALVWACLASKQYVAARQEDDAFERQMQSFSLFGR